MISGNVLGNMPAAADQTLKKRIEKESRLRDSPREGFAKRYFPYREVRILAKRFLFHRKVPLSHMNVSRYFL